MDLFEVADVGERADDADDLGELRDVPHVRLFGDELGHADEVVRVVLVRDQLRHVQRGHGVPGRVVQQVVPLGRADEGGQVCGVREGVQVVLVAEERFPLLAVFPPARRPQGDDVPLRQAEFDRDDVLCHS